MSRKVLADSIILENGKAVKEVTSKLVGELWKQWEIPVLVLLSLTLQVILVLLSNRRRNTNSLLLNAVLWSSYMAADPVAVLTLGVISSNLTDFIKLAGRSAPLDPQTELVTFWAPFLLLHLGGPDTITAFQMEDNELWRRHLLTLVVQTGLTLYILFRAWTMSTLSTLSVLMFTAGSIKYAERTWSLWTSSYEKRRQKADKAFTRRGFIGWRELEEDDDDVRGLNRESEIDRVVIATKMFRDTQGMFADAYVKRNPEFKSIVEEWSSPEVMKIVKMELKMMYDKLYTKARVMFSYTGITLRFISFLLVSIALILFSSSERRKRHFHNVPEYSLTLVVFVASIGLELYAAFLFLTSYWTISWFRENSIAGIARSMKKLASLRTPDWSNRMGQFSEICYLMDCHPKEPQIMSRIILRRRRISLHVYHRPVPDELTHFIHEYLKMASTSDMYSDKHPLLQSRGRVPWERYNSDRDSDLEHFPFLSDAEFGEMIIFFHLVTEVCYCIDRHVFFKDNVSNDLYKDIFRTARVSKHLSRYLMHLFVDSSDLLPQRTPLSKNRFYEEFNPSWEPFFTLFRRGVGGGGKRRRGKVTTHDKAKTRATKAEACKKFMERSGYIGSSEAIFALQFVRLLLKSMRLDDIEIHQVKSRWELLGAVWMELVVFAADQCKGKAHAQHLRQGGELLTHVWVLLGHFGFIDEALLPLNDMIKREQFFSQIPVWDD